MSVVCDSPPRIEHFSGVVDTVRDGVAYLTLTDDIGHEVEIEWDATDLASKSIQEGHHFQLTTEAVDGHTEFHFRPVVALPLDADMRHEIEDVLRRYRERGFLEDQPAKGSVSSGSEFKTAAKRSARWRVARGRVMRTLGLAACASLLVALGIGIEAWRNVPVSSENAYKLLYAQHLNTEDVKTLAAPLHAAKEGRFIGVVEGSEHQVLRPFELSFIEAQAELG